MLFHVASNHRPDAQQVHPRMRDIQKDVDYLAEASAGQLLFAHLHALSRHPLRYLAALPQLLRSGERLKTAIAQMSGAALLLHRHAALPKLHLHAHFTYGGAAVALWAHRLAGTPYSLTLHGADLIYDNPPDLAERLAGAEAIVSISRFNIDYLAQHFPQVRPKYLEVIRMGVPPLASPPPRPPRTATLRILTVGRLSVHKAQHDLISACAHLRDQGLDFVCDIVGGGELHDALAAQIAELGLAAQVRLCGPRFHDEVLALYGQYDLFVLSSITEGQPVVLMEAMRAGIPVVATAISAIPELVQDAGSLVPPADPVALAKAIAAHAQGDDAEKLERARQIVSNEYNLLLNHRQFKAFLESLP